MMSVTIIELLISFANWTVKAGWQLNINC